MDKSSHSVQISRSEALGVFPAEKALTTIAARLYSENFDAAVSTVITLRKTIIERDLSHKMN